MKPPGDVYREYQKRLSVHSAAAQIAQQRGVRVPKSKLHDRSSKYRQCYATVDDEGEYCEGSVG